MFLNEYSDLFQCYTHNNLGWKIHVVDPGFQAPQRNQAVKMTHFSWFAVSLVPIATLLLSR